MSIIPVSRLSSCDLALLGNNLDPRGRRSYPQRGRKLGMVAAVNRSLALVGEHVTVLHPVAAAAGGARACR